VAGKLDDRAGSSLSRRGVVRSRQSAPRLRVLQLHRCDRDGIIRFWNPGAERIFGYSPDEALGRSLDLIIPERLRQRHWEGYRRVMATGHSRYGETDVLSVPALRKDGATISVEFTIVPLQESGRLVAVAAIMRAM
jgi:PAS domain S-box-containing protein